MPLTENDKKRFIMAMSAMSLAFGSQPIDTNRLTLIFEALSDLSIESIEQGCKSIIKNEGRFPVPKTIREHSELFTKRQPAIDYKKNNLFTCEPATQFGKDALDLIKSLFSDKINKKDYYYQCIKLCDLNEQESKELITAWENC